MDIFKRSVRQENWRERWNRYVELGVKTGFLLVLPSIPAAALTAVWYVLLFKAGRHFSPGLEGIATAAWIPTFGVLYGLLAAIVLNTVWNEYKSIRAAVKRYDIETFVDLRDEEMSPLVHALMFALSGAVLGAFMGLKYPDALSGGLLILSTSYVFCLIFFVVVEIDDPCAGIWFIKNIHEEWLTLDVREWRKKRCGEARKRYATRLSACSKRVA